jgi:hypothetical protein
MKTIGMLILATFSTATMPQTTNRVPNVDGYRAPVIQSGNYGLNSWNMPVRGLQECLQRKTDHRIVCHSRAEWEQIARNLSADNPGRKK